MATSWRCEPRSATCSLQGSRFRWSRSTPAFTSSTARSPERAGRAALPPSQPESPGSESRLRREGRVGVVYVEPPAVSPAMQEKVGPLDALGGTRRDVLVDEPAAEQDGDLPDAARECQAPVL